MAGQVDLRDVLGTPGRPASAHTAATREGKGIVFIAYDGEVHPAGFLPVRLGNIHTGRLQSDLDPHGATVAAW